MALFERIYFLSVIIAGIVLPAFIVGCSGSGGSSAIEPLADEPMILESVMCLAVDDERPDGITNVFLDSDDRIYVWIYWTNVERTSTVKAKWYDPDEDQAFREDSQLMRSDSGFVISWFYIDRPAGGFNDGEWLVKIYLDNRFERSHLFIVES